MLTGLIIGFLVAAAAGAVGLGVMAKKGKGVGLLKGGESQKLLKGASLDRGVHEMLVGDVIQHMTQDFLVEGVINYDDDGHRWVTGRLIDGKDERWLMSGMDRIGKGGLRLVAPEPEVQINEFPPEVIHAGGLRFNYERRGNASAKFSGELGALPGIRGRHLENTVERCRYWLYRSAGDDILIVEQWGNEYRALRGENVSEGTISLLPGS